MGTKSDVKQLNSLLRGEISAAETYRMALEKLDATATARPDLEACLASHEQRITMLRDAVVACGGEPAEGSGPWGAFAKAVEGSAKAFGEKAAIVALEEGEDHGIADYRRAVDDLDPSSRRLVNDELLPLQQQTHGRMSRLKHRLSA